MGKSCRQPTVVDAFFDLRAGGWYLTITWIEVGVTARWWGPLPRIDEKDGA